MSNLVIEQVNGEKIWNMKELVEKIESCNEPFIILEDQFNRKIIIDRFKAQKSHQEILDIYRIPSDRSENLRSKE